MPPLYHCSQKQRLVRDLVKTVEIVSASQKIVRWHVARKLSFAFAPENVLVRERHECEHIAVVWEGPLTEDETCTEAGCDQSSNANVSYGAMKQQWHHFDRRAVCQR